MSFRLILATSAGLAMDAFALAVGISCSLLSDISFPVLISTIAAVSFVLSGVGVGLGCRIGRSIRRAAQVTGGVVLVAIAVKILASHLIGQI